MIYSLRIYNLDPARVGPFVTSVRHGGLYRELAHQLYSGYLGCDLLSSNAQSNRFLLLEFWRSEAAFGAAQDQPDTKVLGLFLRNLAISCEDLGAFGFHPSRNLMDAGESSPEFRDHDKG